MATEKQLAFFKSLYDEETARESQLNQAARNNLTLITFYSAFILFVVEKLRPACLLEQSIFVLSVGSILLGFLLSVWAMRIATYEAPNDPMAVIDGFGDEPPSDSDFFDDRNVDYATACKRNSAVNDKKARWLTLAGYAMLLGIALHACYFFVKVF